MSGVVWGLWVLGMIIRGFWVGSVGSSWPLSFGDVGGVCGSAVVLCGGWVRRVVFLPLRWGCAFVLCWGVGWVGCWVVGLAVKRVGGGGCGRGWRLAYCLVYIFFVCCFRRCVGCFRVEACGGYRVRGEARW